MSTNGLNSSEDTEMADCDGEKVVTMMDVLQEQQDFEEDANAVLGASDDKNCTYAKGYIKRQAIYACMTCCSEAKTEPTKRAGVCLACSLACHENHELIELYTKRSFRCDCGNGKFNSNPCQFNANKTDLNEGNNYNQNYSGLYCICHRPYPDPESNVEDEMIQCIICEDWLHATHLETIVPVEQYSEMICKNCMEKNYFLHDYSSLVVKDVDAGNTSDVTTMSTGNNSNTSDSLNKNKQQCLTPEVKPESEHKADMDVEMKNETEMNISSSKHDVDIVSEVERKDEQVSNSETDTMDTISEITKEKESLENKTEEIVIQNTDKITKESKQEDKNANDDNKPNTTPENSLPKVVPEKENLECESLETKMVEEQMTVCKTGNMISESDTTPTDLNIKLADDDCTQSDNKEKSENITEDTDKKEEIESAMNHADLPALNSTSDEKIGTKEDVVKSGDIVLTTDIKETVNVASHQITEKKEDNLLTEPSITEASTDKEQEEEIASDATKSNIGGDNLQTSGNLESTVEPISIPKKTEISISDNIIESDSRNTELQVTALEEPATIHEPGNKIVSSESTSQLRVTSLNDADKPQKDITKVDKMEEETKTNDIIKDEGDVGKIDDSNEENKGEIKLLTNCNENKRKLSTEDEDNAKKVKLEEIKRCVRPKGIERHLKGATFWPLNFRQKLCTCNECQSMYKELAVLFLIDPEDTVTAYEALGKERSSGSSSSQYEKGLQALSSLDRVQQINALTEYNKMRDKLLDFLKSFKDRKEIVKEEDINAFFAGIKPKRRPDGVYFCR